MAAVLGEERHQLAGHLQGGHVAVEVQPVQALDLQRHMLAQQVVDRRHGALPPVCRPFYRLHRVGSIRPVLDGLRRSFASTPATDIRSTC